ncbi:hypothetical protein A5732_05430 [Mycobacterium colombiense]|nr:hypothetical protein A5732_05430 [Mycobacterium colombiense]
MVGVRVQHRVLNFRDAFTQHRGFALEDTRFSHRRRRDSLRDTRKAVPTAYGIHQGRPKLIDIRCRRTGRPISAQRGLVGTRFADIRVGVMGRRDRDGAEQIDHVGVMASRCRLKQGYVGGQSDVRWNPSAGEVGDQQRGGAVVAQSRRPRQPRLLTGHRIDKPL